MSASAFRSRVTRFSLPAERSAASIMRKFVRDIARSTDLTDEELHDLQIAVTSAFDAAIREQRKPGEGRIVLKIDARPNEIDVDISYRETHFPPAELFSRS